MWHSSQASTASVSSDAWRSRSRPGVESTEISRPPIVLDIGSDSIKAGFAGDSEPRALVPTVRKQSRRPNVWSSDLCQSLQSRDAASSRAETETRTSDHVVQGVVNNSCALEGILRETFRQLEADPAAQALVVTEAPFNPKANRELLAQLLFEQFDVPALHLTIPASLSLASQGLTTGVVVDCGHDVTCSVAIYEGFVVPHAVRRIDLGGREITEQLGRLLATERGCQRFTRSDAGGRLSARRLKEEHCFVAGDAYCLAADSAPRAGSQHADASGGDLERVFVLPDGTRVTVGRERFCAPEVLFQPMQLGMEVAGMHEMTYRSITECDLDLQRALAEGIVLAGGTMQLPGMEARMQKELRSLLPLSLPTKVSLLPTPQHSAFVGGSIMSSIMMSSDHSGKWVTLEEYEDSGVIAVHRRCPCLLEAGEQASIQSMRASSRGYAGS